MTDDELSGEREPSSLRPSIDIQKFVLSATCSFVGEFDNPDLLLTHAWEGFGHRPKRPRPTFGPNTFMLVLRVDDAPKSKILIPSYRGEVEAFCAYVSLLYGKRFTSHGGVEVSGFYNLPDLNGMEGGLHGELPQNSEKRRADISVPLALEEVERLAPLLNGEAFSNPHAQTFLAAAKFYHQALHAAEQDIEVAYLHLITAGEVLSAAFDIPDEALFDADIRSILQRMESEMQDGSRAARAVKGRMLGIKRRFVVAFDCLIDDAFFERGESERPFERLKKDSFKKTLGAAYDLRSKYVHTGQPFGGWVNSHGPTNAELQFGKPYVPHDREFERLIGKVPTYVGLERIIRYGILRFGGSRLGINLTVDEQPSADDATS